MSKYLESCNNECKIVMLLLVAVLGYLLYQCYNKNKACAREGFAKVGTYVEISFDEYYSLAKKYFEGGGHRNAAGGISFLSLSETVAKIKMILPEFEEMLKQ